MMLTQLWRLCTVATSELFGFRRTIANELNGHRLFTRSPERSSTRIQIRSRRPGQRSGTSRQPQAHWSPFSIVGLTSVALADDLSRVFTGAPPGDHDHTRVDRLAALVQRRPSVVRE